jgi:hypothetical protein
LSEELVDFQFIRLFKRVNLSKPLSLSALPSAVQFASPLVQRCCACFSLDSQLKSEGFTGRIHYKVHPVARNVHARHGVYPFVDLRDHDAAAEGRGLEDGWGVFGVWAGVEVAVGIGSVRGDQRNLRREVNKVASEQLQVRLNGPICKRPGVLAKTTPAEPCADRERAPRLPATKPWPESRPWSWFQFWYLGTGWGVIWVRLTNSTM